VADSVTLTTLPRVSVNGRDVEDEIRSDEINEAVSVVAAIPRFARPWWRDNENWPPPSPWAPSSRDATSRRWSFLTPRSDIPHRLARGRARRRGDEGEVSVARRDEADSTRVASPLRQADDALVLDTTVETSRTSPRR